MFESLLFQVSSEMELNLRETVAESVTNFCDENAFSCDRSDSKMWVEILASQPLFLHLFISAT